MSNDEQDDINNMLWERYRMHLESLPHKCLVEYFENMTKEQLIELIQDADPVGKGDGTYE